MADLDLPNEITTIVLSNLPVKSLLRFKCISKPWNSWISSRRRQGAIAWNSWNSTLFFRFINQQLTLDELNYTSSDDDIYLLSCSLLGSCDGLILINRNEHIYLWNPTTQFYTKVLELDRLNDDGYSIRGGLCFDSSKNVYKAVLIMRHQTPDYGGEFVIVTSLKDKRWRTVKFPYDICSVCDGITLHGRLHYRLRVKKKDESMWDSFGPCKV
ncbi:PREDICTED: putative F-box protein At5g62060 [Nicotiana attenuata]|uniref:F-box domain-containing protein n=1 Tax=Nicotiana attenuata TaxID=49451 RepID=A0A1J6HXS3_NICAT|nr:PREDICTED: putative F-box protein At5g62060 [Nicotiana attenuata]OIS97153.1 hypothetical protein A4A49_51741 [Nicotiana attenuata]